MMRLPLPMTLPFFRPRPASGNLLLALSALGLCALPGWLSARNLECTVRYECEGGSCRAVSRFYRTTAGPEAITVQTQDMTVALAMLDKSSGGDLVYGGQIGDKLYGVFFLDTDNSGHLLIQGVNGWSESKSELLICMESAS